MWNKKLLGSLAIVSLGAILAAVSGCGDSDGGSDEESAANNDNYVADGGAGSSIAISVKGRLTVGGTAGFSVILVDPYGLPLERIPVVCDTEEGIAILEPIQGGIAVEHTDQNGQMSGLLGGERPGSYMLECRAADSFGLVARTTLKITGDVPNGFTGFTGAVGGNLGGGRVVDD